MKIVQFQITEYLLIFILPQNLILLLHYIRLLTITLFYSIPCCCIRLYFTQHILLQSDTLVGPLSYAIFTLLHAGIVLLYFITPYNTIGQTKVNQLSYIQSYYRTSSLYYKLISYLYRFWGLLLTQPIATAFLLIIFTIL